ncbi:MAG: RNA polymerase sigma factor for flagellar operon [Melioribacteraceae bacterium]|nr:MAG: RNA polymerase sigma factor for flagellar operon [Melioribacteraceae bacterium]
MNNSLLWTKFKKSPSEALKKQIILNYSNLVHYVIYNSKFVNQTILEEKDFYQFGIEGLSEAIDRFDPEYGTKFETYAIQRIRGKILDEIRKVQIKPRRTGDDEQKIYYSNVSLNQPVDNEEGYLLYEKIPDEIETPEDTVEKDEEKELLLKFIQTLEERDRLILSLYYYEHLNYKDIASILKITVSRVSQIHSKIIKQLQQKMIKVHA